MRRCQGGGDAVLSCMHTLLIYCSFSLSLPTYLYKAALYPSLYHRTRCTAPGGGLPGEEGVPGGSGVMAQGRLVSPPSTATISPGGWRLLTLPPSEHGETQEYKNVGSLQEAK